MKRCCINPKLSVITVTYNSVKTLERTIISVIEQNRTDLEYIVVDGGSTDGTLEVIRKYGYFISQWVSEPDDGIYDAMNKGIAMAKGEWIHLLNSDDYYENPEALSKVIPLLENPDSQFHYFNMYQEIGESRHEYAWSGPKYLLWYSAYLPHPTMFVGKMAYYKVGLYDIRFKIAADHDMILRLLKGRVKAIHHPVLIAVMTIGGLSGQNLERTFGDFRDVIVKNGFNTLFAEVLYLFKVFKMDIMHVFR